MAFANGEAPLKDLRAHGEDFNLHTTELRFAGDLLLGRVAFAQGHRHELADDSFLNAIPIKPRLLRHDQVVLWVAAEAVLPRFAGDGVDLAGGDFDREGIGGFPIFNVAAVEPEPKGLGLPHGEEDATTFEPIGRHERCEIIYVAQGEKAATGAAEVQLRLPLPWLRAER